MTAPLVRARVVEYLVQHVVPGVRRWNGQIPTSVETQDMAHELGISPHDVNETLWALQKQQIVTFKERKGPKGSVISRIRIADTALNGLEVNKLAQVLSTDEEVLDQAIDIVTVTHEITREAKTKGPAAALTSLLEQMPDGIRIRDANLRLGYGKESTAIYSLARFNPGTYIIEQGKVRLVNPPPVEAVKTYPNTPCTNRTAAPEWCVEHDSLWHKGDMFCVREWEQRNTDVVEAGADAQNDASTTPTEEIVDDLPVILVPPGLAGFPNIRALIAESGSQGAARKAADILSDAGLDSLALTVIDAVRSFTPLENEVIALAAVLGWLDG